MNAKFVIRFTTLIFSLAFVLGIALTARAQTTTNGMGGATDVGTWYMWAGNLSNDWSGAGVNYLPLSYWSTIPDSGALSGTYETYNPEDSTIISEDLAALAAARIDFIVLDLTNDSPGCITTLGVDNGTTCSNNGQGDGYVVWASDVATAVKTWNASNSWKIRYAIAVCPPNHGPAEDLATAVYSAFVTNASFGGIGNTYQIDGQPLLVMFGGPGSGPGSGFCSGDCGNFYFGNASQQGAGQWGWAPHGANQLGGPTQVDPNGVVENVSPGWFNQQPTIVSPFSSPKSIWTPREDGAFYQGDWNVVFTGTPAPRVVVLSSYNDWLEAQALGNGDTLSPRYIPSPVYDMYEPGYDEDFNRSYAARMDEVWTFPDQNVHFDGYWNYTTAAICYLRNNDPAGINCGTNTSPLPVLPQPAPNLAVSAAADASSCAGGGCSDLSFLPSNAADGNPATMWASQEDFSANPSNPEWIRLTWTSAQTFNTVVLVGRNVSLGQSDGFPVTFEIDADISGTWTKLVQETNFPQRTIPGQPIAFTWGSSVMATAVRVKATTLGVDLGGNYYFQLGEFEVLNEGSTATMPVLANWGFEAPAQLGPNSQSNPTGAGWTFSGSSGVQEVGSAFDSPMAPQGIQTGYITGSSSSISQAITLPAGNYTLRFLASETDGSSQSIQVSYGSTNIGSFGSFPFTGFAPYITSSFMSTGASQYITFSGAGSGTALIDEVQIFNQSSISVGGGEQTQVPLFSQANTSGIYSDGTPFGTGGLDAGGYAYSANLLGSSLTASGTTFSFLPANTENAVKGISTTVIPLPSGNYSTLNFLGAAVNGSQASQTFTVNYTDSTQAQFSQGISDWCSPQSYTGETTPLTTAYRDTSSGGEQTINCNLYEYSFPLNSAKTVESLTLPTNNDVAVLAITLGGGSGNSLLLNPSWGTGDLTDWNVSYCCGGSPSDATVQSYGSGSQFYFVGEAHQLEISAASGAFKVAAYQNVIAPTGATSFIVSVYAQTSPNTTGAGILVQDGPGGTTLCSTSIPANVSTWTQYFCQGTVPSDRNITLSLYNNEGSGNADWWANYVGTSVVVN